jgi:cytochrome c-type biogenesis protein CcmH/NrfF
MMILVLWSLPVTAFVLGLVWIKRGRNRANSEVTR